MPRERLIEFNEDDRENKDDILEKCYNEFKISIKKILIEYTGLEDLQQLMIKRSNPLLVKFNSWYSCKRFYQARPKMNPRNKRKPGTFTFSVSPDLIKRRYKLLKYARGIVNDNEIVAFAFAVSSDAPCHEYICSIISLT